MPQPVLLFGVGATKAGTSWLYRYLSAHPDCAMPSVKEAHYWDSFTQSVQDRQITQLQSQVNDLQTTKAEKDAQGPAWQIRKIARRIDEVTGLMDVLRGDRRDDLAYRKWLLTGREDARIVGDVTPSYSLLPDDMLSRMLHLTPTTRFIYLIRDPLDRLWSHIRMIAHRQQPDVADFTKKANAVLSRTLDRGTDTPTFARGDYRTNIARLRRVIPQDRLLVQFFEDLFTPAGVARLCDFLGIAPLDKMRDRVIHGGQKAVMQDALRPKALQMLRAQYDWVAQNVGPLPQRWQDNQARMTA